MDTAGALEHQELMSEGKDLRLQRCSSLKSLPSRRNQRENDREHVAEKLQRRLPKFNQFSQNEVFGRDNGNIDPARPMKSWRSAWRKLTRVIECPACKKMQEPRETCANPKCKADLRDIKSPLTGLRFHDLRHQAITELAESQASDQTIMAIAGHVSHQMLDHYSHVRLDAKRQALDALVNRPKPEPVSDTNGYGTKNVTNIPQHGSVTDPTS